MVSGDGAGDGNRTHAASLEGWNSTIEQHPHQFCSAIIPQREAFVKKKNQKNLNCFRMSA